MSRFPPPKTPREDVLSIFRRDRKRARKLKEVAETGGSVKNRTISLWYVSFSFVSIKGEGRTYRVQRRQEQRPWLGAYNSSFLRLGSCPRACRYVYVSLMSSYLILTLQGIWSQQGEERNKMNTYAWYCLTTFLNSARISFTSAAEARLTASLPRRRSR